MSLSLAIAGCSFDTAPIFPGRDVIPDDPNRPRRDADVPPPPPGADAGPQPEAGPSPMAGSGAPEMDAATDAQVEMDGTVPMDAAGDGASSDAEPPDAAPDDGATPDATPDASVCPDPIPCVCAQHAPITPPSQCAPSICPDQGCHPDSDCTLKYDRTSAYYFCRNQRPWDEAAEFCEDVEMKLATIDDEHEDDLVFDNIAAKVWLGGHDGEEDEEGVWRWPDGRVFYREDDEGPGPGPGPGPQPVPGAYVNWHESEPNNEGLSDSPADCLLFWFENGVWADGSCDDENGYVCEVERE